MKRSTSAPMVRPRLREPPAWNDTSGTSDALGRPEEVLHAARRKLNAARIAAGMSWEELFVRCDADRSGTMDWKECRHMARDILRVRPSTVDDRELRLVFDDADIDKNGHLDVAEYLEYLWHGRTSEELGVARQQQRVERVRRNVFGAFAKQARNEECRRKLFEAIDLDGSRKLSKHELTKFIREKLGLTRWDVLNSDLDVLYCMLDETGRGITFDRFLDFVRQASRSTREQLTPAEKFHAPPPDAEALQKKLRMRKTYKSQLVLALSTNSSGLAPSVSGPCFTSVGREHRPHSRAAVSRG